MTGTMRKNTGSNFDDWLREKGIYQETIAATIKRVLALTVCLTLRIMP